MGFILGIRACTNVGGAGEMEVWNQKIDLPSNFILLEIGKKEKKNITNKPMLIACKILAFAFSDYIYTLWSMYIYINLSVGSI